MKAISISIGVLLASIACAQAPAPDVYRYDGIDFQATLRLRVEAYDWFEPTTGTGEYGFSGNILRFGASKSAENWDWQAEFAVPFLLGLPSTAIAAGAQGQLGQGASYYVANGSSENSAMIFPKQLFFRWKNLGGVKGQSFRIGRLEFLDGSEHAARNSTIAAIKRDHVYQRLIGPFGFTDVGRSFDGIQYSSSGRRTTLRSLRSYPPGASFKPMAGVGTGWAWVTRPIRTNGGKAATPPRPDSF